MTDQTDKLMQALSQMETDPDGNVYVPESARQLEIAKRNAMLDKLEGLFGKMLAGPYEYWDEHDNDILAARCHDGDGVAIAALAGIVSMPDEFRAIAALLNATPDLIRWARRGIQYQENVKEHATLSAGASVERGVEVETTGEHVNRAADRGCCVSSCSTS